ncbi:amino acid carrier protein [Christiangramia fulva]|uniref:Amino acid carrier protein n=1 Tax=Christiangramia fulva TaxID=2126553 RepID=A0A2R3ZA44_9FLAO|nr:amino acid carrier protein [Christiangramia fulva]AVR47145.1 amino acid carrier protein [Christiangramia fulva]
MIKYLITLIVLLSFPIQAQNLQVNADLGNTSKLINDGYIKLKVSGGTPPYTYKWSDKNTSLESSSAYNLTEGTPYQVLITDSKGKSTLRSYEIQPIHIAEYFNGTAVPLVGSLKSFLFWDPFSAFGFYDPKVYADVKKVPIPNWNPTTHDKYYLKKWLVKEDTLVRKGTIIAIVTSENYGDFPVKANATGNLKHLVQSKEMIYNSDSKQDIIEIGAHNLAEIKYQTPVLVKYPNGDPKTHTIPLIVIWLIIGAAFFTIRMGFINFKGIRHSINLAKGKFDDPDAPGKITHFQTMATAVSATVGLGNIAGVAIAISVGGAGATFWMIIAGFLGMASKFVECTLGVKYRIINPDGKIFGGPMNYLRYGLEKRNLGRLGKLLATLFALLCVGATLGGGNMFQANQSFQILASQFVILQGNGFYFGLILATLVGAVIIGGIESIGKVTGRIVPVMAVIYVFSALLIIGMNIQNLGSALYSIYNGAFNTSAMKGGVIGVMIVGFQRAVFSSESGVGSAAIAHSAGKTNYPISEGFVALLEPFIDTVVICTLTALVLIFTGMHEVQGISGVQLTSDAFATVISWFPYVLTIVVFLFAFSTMISWSYYGMRAWTFLFGKSNKSELLFKIIFLLFVVIGASVGLGAVLDFADMMILMMSFPNIIGLYIMSGEVKEDLDQYIFKLKRQEIVPKKNLFNKSPNL